MKYLSIGGARPQFVKAAALSQALRRTHAELLIHTEQHHGENMSSLFFEGLGIPAPDANLEIGLGSHGAQTGKMLAVIEEITSAHWPDCVIVKGDTNSTLAGAVAVVELNSPTSAPVCAVMAGRSPRAVGRCPRDVRALARAAFRGERRTVGR